MTCRRTYSKSVTSGACGKGNTSRPTHCTDVWIDEAAEVTEVTWDGLGGMAIIADPNPEPMFAEIEEFRFIVSEIESAKPPTETPRHIVKRIDGSGIINNKPEYKRKLMFCNKGD